MYDILYIKDMRLLKNCHCEDCEPKAKQDEAIYFLRLLLPPKSGGIAMTRETDSFSNLDINK
ncbi:MAG: hypothetical protein A3I73_02100 [Omnitrophica bacterium RIFCSPLOWO2_02_FULL_45_16]|nr:MAG: hypothetical protein A3G36_06590 [Omnitrophica bacterium RIFCSPLOWO2_12_FULL_45_13]OGX01436.1 MAG: hypothetical protein A3I73_02100 [Omnitrophica bacterium RIFCSPLOWO2_02_FULL_45_16]